MKLVRLIANLGYGSRKQVAQLFRAGHVTDARGEVLYANDQAVSDQAGFDRMGSDQMGPDQIRPDQIRHVDIRIGGEPLDPPAGLVLMLDKPLGVTCSRTDPGRVVYDLLPSRYNRRTPALSTVGRLDRDTSGLLLFTDDGALLHRIISPRAQVTKVYEATLAQNLRGDEGDVFASGTLLLESEQTPLAPARLDVQGPRHVRLAVTEGRYHQVRRMFAAVGNHVETLRRVALGGLALGDLQAGQWRALDGVEVAKIFQENPFQMPPWQTSQAAEPVTPAVNRSEHP